MKLLDEDWYEKSHILRTAFFDGQLAMCEYVGFIISRVMTENSLSRSGDKSEYESGQIHAYTTIIENCNAFFAETSKKQDSDIKYDA